MTLRHEIFKTSLVVLVAILRCCLSDELRWVPSRVAAGTMAIAHLLALARSFAVVRFTNCSVCEGSPKCKNLMLGKPVPQVTSSCASVVEAERQLCNETSCAAAWFGKKLTTEKPDLLVLSFALMGAVALHFLCMIFGQPSLLSCCSILWPTALLMGNVANMVSRAPPRESVQSSCFCARQGGCCCGTCEDCPYNAEFWASVSSDATQAATAHAQ